MLLPKNEFQWNFILGTCHENVSIKSTFAYNSTKISGGLHEDERAVLEWNGFRFLEWLRKYTHCVNASQCCLCRCGLSKVLSLSTNLSRPYYNSPTSLQGLPGTDCYPSLSSGLASQPSGSTTSAPAKQQATKTTIDIWCATLRMRHWTPPSPPPTNNRTLAHRKSFIHVFWLLILVLKKKTPQT